MLLMMGGETPETCWAIHKRQVINLWNCCILLVELFESYDDARICERQSPLLIFFPHSATSCRGPEPPHYWGFAITLRHTTHTVEVLWTSDQLDAEMSTWQHTTLTRDKHPWLGGIRTRNPSKRAAADPRFKPRGHRDGITIKSNVFMPTDSM
jgi:hypothetical protein